MPGIAGGCNRGRRRVVFRQSAHRAGDDRHDAREGHKALVHTAAASNLGQMLNRLCLTDGIGLVNIVRKKEQEDLLRAAGAVHVCRTDSATFFKDLTEALVSTGATIGFDAIGGGPLAGQILGLHGSGRESRRHGYSRYGSTTHKQVYLYGSLDMSPTVLNRNYGMAWGIGGWLLHAIHRKDRPAGVSGTQGAGGQGTENHFCQPIFAGDIVGGSIAAGCRRRLFQTCHGQEISHQSQ